MTKKHNDYKRILLIRFIDYYLSKPDIQMKDLLNNLKLSLNRRGKITLKQFNAIIKFVERERPFKGKRRSEIIDYFGPLISGYRKEVTNVSNTLFE